MASVAGHSFVAPAPLSAAYWLLENWANAQRKKNSVPQHIPRPWEASSGEQGREPRAPDAASLARRQKLAERFGLPTPT